MKLVLFSLASALLGLSSAVIISKGNEVTCDRPSKAGDLVIVTYRGYLFSNGTTFDSTKLEGGEPFNFTLGSGEVITGYIYTLLFTRLPRLIGLGQ
jgi:FKBP-type peptidyl-prolyl cis-trans isomerase